MSSENPSTVNEEAPSQNPSTVTEEEASQKSLGYRCEIKAYHKTVEDGVPKREKVRDPFADLDNNDDRAYALIIERTFKEQEPKQTSLTVNSSHILEAFRKVIKYYEPVPSDFTSPVVLRDPFTMLVHYWEKLDDYRRNSALGSETREHMDLLFKFMTRELKADRDNTLTMIKNGQVEFKNAWMIFKPGEVLYTEMYGQPWLLVCKKVAYEESKEDGKYFQVHAEYTDHNGTVVGNAIHQEVINQRDSFPQENPVSITGLKIFPRRYLKVTDTLEQQCRARGEEFLALEERSTVTYNGPADELKKPGPQFYDPSGCKYRGVFLPYHENGRVVLDRKTYREENQMLRVKVKRADPRPWLCPPFTMGYSVARKKWCRFMIDNISTAGWKPDAWGSLVLPEREKGLLRSLVSSHEYSKDPRDHTKQKGKGLVVLLHGTPGSGKTLTAEVAAEASQKVLVSTSVGELNRFASAFSSSQEFEYELKKILQYATIWHGVVLFDEADVFLEARKDNNSNRNSLVATFLKELEYFSGIVFLTTNRVTSFDIAMKSRIHLALGYQPPTADVRRQIWKQYLNVIPTGKINVRTDEGVRCVADAELKSDEVIEKLALEADLNGREIANAVNTACTLARFQNSRLKLDHIDTVLGVRKTFEESLPLAMDGDRE